MQVMVTQHHGHVISVIKKPAQDLQILRSTIDEIAYAPEPVFVGVKFDLFQ